MTNDFPPDTSTPPRPGNAVFYKDCRPPLLAGDYVLGVQQEIRHGSKRVDEGEEVTRPLPGEREHKFTITGPRFLLDPADIHAAFPPPNSEGPFESRLPQIVLKRRTLPWERSADNHGTPWLALLLFEKGEISDPEKSSWTVGEIYANDPSPVAPEGTLTLTDDEKAIRCLGIEVPLSTFRQVAPLREEVELLTHVRQVNTEDKELLGMDKDGWFSVVVGNRLPAGGKEYVACLVSLEGRIAYLPEDHAELTWDDVQIPWMPTLIAYGVVYDAEAGEWVAMPPPPVLRLVCLARWEFACALGGDFQSIMRSIPHRGGVAMLGMEPHQAVLPEDVPETAYKVALDSGHVPLGHQTRDGESAIAWYRGPLVPAGVARDTTTGPYHTADQARRIDPLTGLENLGYAAAFEIGRLLALSDPQFALQLLRWRRGGHDRVSKAVFDGRLAALLPGLLTEFDPSNLIDPRQIAIPVIEDVSQLVREELIGPLADPTGFGLFQGEMVGLDAAIVAVANNFDQGMLEGMYAGTLVGTSPQLETMGIQDTLTLEAEFEKLVETADAEFGHLRALRDQEIGW